MNSSLPLRVLVTGANRGIGLELVRQYRDAGAEVLATARTPEKATELNELGVEVLTLNVANEGSVQAFSDAISGRPLDVVINNAGIYGPRDAQNADRMDYKAWQEVLLVNTLGPMRIAQAVLPSLLLSSDSSAAGKLVSITSMMGSIAGNGGGHYAYRSSKAALNSVMVGLAQDWRTHGIAVAVLHPGWVQTDMGGPGATLTTNESVSGMRAVVEGLTLETSGTFLNYDGSKIAW